MLHTSSIVTRVINYSGHNRISRKTTHSQRNLHLVPKHLRLLQEKRGNLEGKLTNDCLVLLMNRKGVSLVYCLDYRTRFATIWVCTNVSCALRTWKAQSGPSMNWSIIAEDRKEAPTGPPRTEAGPNRRVRRFRPQVPIRCTWRRPRKWPLCLYHRRNLYRKRPPPHHLHLLTLISLLNYTLIRLTIWASSSSQPSFRGSRECPSRPVWPRLPVWKGVFPRRRRGNYFPYWMLGWTSMWPPNDWADIRGSRRPRWRTMARSKWSPTEAFIEKLRKKRMKWTAKCHHLWRSWPPLWLPPPPPWHRNRKLKTWAATHRLITMPSKSKKTKSTLALEFNINKLFFFMFIINTHVIFII